MPLIAWAVAAYVVGLLAGFSGTWRAPLLAGAALAPFSLAADARRGRLVCIACALLAATGWFVARDASRRDARCAAQAVAAQQWLAGTARRPCEPAVGVGARPGPFARWRERTGVTIDSLFAGDAPLVRALLIADERSIAPDVRDRFAASGLVHVLSISGLHVAIIAEAVLLLFEALRLGRVRSRWAALFLTALYVAAIGAPAPALRSAVMLGAFTASRTLQRPVSPWASLAIGAAVPLADPRTATDLGWQLSVAGFAALTGATLWTKRHLRERVRGWRRSMLRDLAVSSLATIVTAPLVAWSFGRVSLIAPLTNLAAGPVISLLQPTLFLTLIVAPVRPLGHLAAAAARPLLAAMNGIADAGAAVPAASLTVAPTLAVAVAAGAATVALLVAASSRDWPRPLAAAALCAAAAVWWPFAPVGSGLAELHVIDVGQGDALAVRTPRGRWILVDAGRSWARGDAGRTTVVPYLRRRGGDLALFVLTHPDADHVGGAATVLHALRPALLRDAAFAGGSAPYRRALEVAARLDIPWRQVRLDDSLDVDGVVVRFLAPDPGWTAALRDPNLASVVALVRYGSVRFLLTGDAEAPEEEWLLSTAAPRLRADVLKVGHHGSATSSIAAFLDAVQPRVAVVSVGAGNGYGHPARGVLAALRTRGATVLRTDQLGTIVLRTDGRHLEAEVGPRTWTVPPRQAHPLSLPGGPPGVLRP